VDSFVDCFFRVHVARGPRNIIKWASPICFSSQCLVNQLRHKRPTDKSPREHFPTDSFPSWPSQIIILKFIFVMKWNASSFFFVFRFFVSLSIFCPSPCCVCAREKEKREPFSLYIVTFGLFWDFVAVVTNFYRMGNDAGVVQVIVQFDLWERNFEVR
jgi:hypothetical protein